MYIRAVSARAQRSPLSVGTCSRFSGRDIFETICMTTDNNIHSENFIVNKKSRAHNII